MWQWLTTAWEGVKSLLGGKGTIQIGSGNKSVSGVTIGDNAGGVVIGDVIHYGPQIPPPQPLSDFAKQILIDAAADSNGKIYFSHNMHGYNLQAGKTEIRNCMDRRQIAGMEAALQELQKAGATKIYGDVGYKITAEGFKLADKLRSQT